MSPQLSATLAPLVYVLSAAAFIVGLKSVAHVRTLGRGARLVFAAFVLAVVGAVIERGVGGGRALLVALGGAVVGGLLASRVSLTAPGSRVAWVGALGGLGAAALALGWLTSAANGDVAAVLATSSGVAAALALVLGGVGGLAGVALALSGGTTPAASGRAAVAVSAAGLATGLLGFAVENVILLIVGGLAGTAGIALGRIVAASSGRSLGSLVFGGAGATGEGRAGYANVRSCGIEEAAMMLEGAQKVVVVPGFGMALAQAQHAVKELVEQLAKRGSSVHYVIHPSAGCLPGHMNIVLDEANVPHEHLVELEDANRELSSADAALVIGANDIVNLGAESDAGSPLAGLPIVAAHKAKAVFVVKRTLATGAAGAKNPLFELPNTTMIFGDAKKVAQGLVAELKGAGH